MTGRQQRSYSINVKVPLTVFALIALMIGISFVAQRGWEPEIQAKRVSQTDPLMIGQPDAPVELVVFSDYQCPFCAHWSRETLPELLNYVDEGNLRILWRNVHLSGDAAERGARGAYAAALQNSFLEFHQALVQDGRGAADEDLTENALIDLAEGLGLDVARFTADMNSGEVATSIRSHAIDGQRQGVTRAPSFVFDGEFISGVKPTDVFITNIEAALDEHIK